MWLYLHFILPSQLFFFFFFGIGPLQVLPEGTLEIWRERKQESSGPGQKSNSRALARAAGNPAVVATCRGVSPSAPCLLFRLILYA